MVRAGRFFRVISTRRWPGFRARSSGCSKSTMRSPLTRSSIPKTARASAFVRSANDGRKQRSGKPSSRVEVSCPLFAELPTAVNIALGAQSEFRSCSEGDPLREDARLPDIEGRRDLIPDPADAAHEYVVVSERQRQQIGDDIITKLDVAARHDSKGQLAPVALRKQAERSGAGGSDNGRASGTHQRNAGQSKRAGRRRARDVQTRDRHSLDHGSHGQLVFAHHPIGSPMLFGDKAGLWADEVIADPERVGA